MIKKLIEKIKSALFIVLVLFIYLITKITKKTKNIYH